MTCTFWFAEVERDEARALDLTKENTELVGFDPPFLIGPVPVKLEVCQIILHVSKEYLRSIEERKDSRVGKILRAVVVGWYS